MAKKENQLKRENAMKDMNEFLVMYATRHLNHQNPEDNINIAEQLYNLIKNGDLTKLDDLFKDGGVARKENYIDVAKGFVIDFYEPVTDEETNKLTDDLIHDAINYLSQHAHELDQWQR